MIYARAKKNGFLLSFFAIIAIITSLRLQSFQALSYIGNLSFVFLIFFVLLVGLWIILAYGRINKKDIGILVSFGFMGVLYTVSMLWTADKLSGSIKILQLLVLLCLFYGVYSMSRREELGSQIRIGGFFAYTVIIILFALCAIKGFVRGGLGFINPNALGMWMIALFYFALTVPKSRNTRIEYFLFLIVLSVVFVSGSRTSGFGLILGSFVYYFWDKIYKKRIISRAIFWSIIITHFITIYLFLFSANNVMYYLNIISFHYTGKNILSGRHVLWPIVLSAIKDRLWFGWGGGALLSNITDYNLSSHNLFLQIALQLGLFGLLIFITGLYVVWKEITKLKYTPYSGITAGFYVSLLIIQIFEVTLTQNNISLSLPFWILLGFSLGDNERRRRLVSCNMENNL